MKIHDLWTVLKNAASDWQEDKVPRFAAAIAYYSIFSMAPLVMIAIAIVGWMFGEEAAQGQVFQKLHEVLGDAAAQSVQDLVVHAAKPGGGLIATAIGLVALLLGASGVFAAVKDALDAIWEVELKPGLGLWGMVRDRFLAFLMVLCIGLLLLASLLISSILSGASSYINQIIPIPSWGLKLLDWGVTLVVTSLLFAAVYKILPDVKTRWSDVWIGAILTAILFAIGRWLIGLYLGIAAVGSAYGAAGSLVVLLLFVYYSALVVLFGAELTQATARQRGAQLAPSDRAQFVTEEKRAQQGLGPRKSDQHPPTSG